jgi:(p)ppGpp synthase/HD superfamily hydrolase
MHYLKSNDEELQCMALLHDVVEDTKTTWKDLEDIGCTPRIIAAVKALTKMPGQSYEEYKEGIFSNPDSMKVKMADLRHNTDIRRLKGISQKDIERMAKYNQFYLEIQAKLQVAQ